MPHASAKDGVKLYYEETGSGTPLVFVHEMGADCRNWEPQVRFFSRFYRCIAFNARGYPPSEVPSDPDQYSQQHARDDVIAVMDHLHIDKAHIVGLSQGGFAVLHVAMKYPQRARSIVAAGAGSGAPPQIVQQFRKEANAAADMIEREGILAWADRYAVGPARVQYQNKDPRGWAESIRMLKEHSPLGTALTLRGYQGKRPSLYDLTDDLKRIEVPTLIITGDEDEPCVDPSVFLKRTIPSSGLLVIPKTGHACNLEEPDAFNRALQDFFLAVELGKWGKRDPRASTQSILGLDK